MIIQLISYKLQTNGEWAGSELWSAVTGCDKFDPIFEFEMQDVGIRKDEGRQAGGREGGRRYEERAGVVARHNTEYSLPAGCHLYGGCPDPVQVPPRVSPLSARSLPSSQPLAQFQTSLAKQLTVGRESLTSIAPHSVLAAGHKQKQEIRLPC